MLEKITCSRSLRRCCHFVPRRGVARLRVLVSSRCCVRGSRSAKRGAADSKGVCACSLIESVKRGVAARKMQLNLENYEEPGYENHRYVLTSPRSLRVNSLLAI